MTLEQGRALGVLEDLFVTAKGLEDDRTKIKMQAQIADLLWDYDEASARRLFQAAFDAITTAKQPERGANERYGALSGATPQAQLRGDVVRLVARRDKNFAERLIKSVVETTPAASELERSVVSAFTGNTSERAMLYLQLAMNLVATEPQAAAAYAKMSLASGGGVHFMFPGILFAIRLKDAQAADALFREALAAARRDPAWFHINASLLRTYVFTEQGETGAVFDMIGGASGQNTNPVANPALIREYLDFAYDGIMRDANSPPQNPASDKPPDHGLNAGMTYALALGLLPLFEQHMPERANALRARVNDLAGRVPPQAARNITANHSQTRSVDELLGKAESAKTPREKDNFYRLAAMETARRKDADMDQALSIVGKISNEGLRTMIESMVRFMAATRAVRNGDVEAAYRYAQGIKGVEQRAGVFGMLAQSLLEKKQEARALEVLADAQSFTTRAATSPEKARAMLMVAGVAARLDPQRGFEAMQLAVGAINEADAATPQEDLAQVMGRTVLGLVGIDAMNFDQTLSVLARADFDRALWLAQEIKKKETSLLAQLAACRGVLVKRDDRRRAAGVN